MATAARHGALASDLGRRSMADTMAAFRDIMVATLMPTGIARTVPATDMATTTQAIRTTTIVQYIVGIIGRWLRACKLGWPVSAITPVRSTA